MPNEKMCQVRTYFCFFSIFFFSRAQKIHVIFSTCLIRHTQVIENLCTDAESTMSAFSRARRDDEGKFVFPSRKMLGGKCPANIDSYF